MKCYELTDSFTVAASAEAVWEFFSEAKNLPRITPPWLHFQIVASPEKLHARFAARLHDSLGGDQK